VRGDGPDDSGHDYCTPYLRRSLRTCSTRQNWLISPCEGFFRHLVLPPHTLMRQSGTTYWNPTMSGHVQVRLPLLASHRQHGREPFLVGRKVRKHDVGLRVLASVLAGWIATLQLRDSWAPQQTAFITTRCTGYLLRRERPAAPIFIRAAHDRQFGSGRSGTGLCAWWCTFEQVNGLRTAVSTRSMVRSGSHSRTAEAYNSNQSSHSALVILGLVSPITSPR
jgi:hypothetical protein